MYIIPIKMVIWSDRKWNKGSGQNAVGISEKHMSENHDNWIGVSIAQKSKSTGEKYFRNPYKILKSRVREFGVDYKKGTKLFIVPLKAMIEMESEDVNN